jgi:hypothetical protein
MAKAAKHRHRIVMSKVNMTIAVDRIRADTLHSALDQILLQSGLLAQNYNMQFPVAVRAAGKSGKCFVTMEITFDGGTWKSRVLELNLPQSGVAMPIFIHLQSHDGQRIKALIQRRSQKTVPKQLFG